MATLAVSGQLLSWAEPRHAPAAGRKSEERRRLLHIVIVGGGPTGVEFAGELSSFVSSVRPPALPPDLTAHTCPHASHPRRSACMHAQPASSAVLSLLKC